MESPNSVSNQGKNLHIIISESVTLSWKENSDRKFSYRRIFSFFIFCKVTQARQEETLFVQTLPEAIVMSDSILHIWTYPNYTDESHVVSIS